MRARRLDNEYPCSSDPEHKLTTFMSGCSLTEARILSNSSDDNLESMRLIVVVMAESPGCSLKALSPPEGACGEGAWVFGFAWSFGSARALAFGGHESSGVLSFNAVFLTPVFLTHLFRGAIESH